MEEIPSNLPYIFDFLIDDDFVGHQQYLTHDIAEELADNYENQSR